MDEAWKRDCEQAADHHIRTCMERERRQLTQRLHEAAGGQQDPIRRCLADVMISGTQYLSQPGTSNVARAEDLADDLLRLHHQLLPSEVCQAVDEAGGDLQLRVEQIAREHGPAVRRSLTVDEVRQAILHSLRHEEHGPAYRSPIRLRLYRLAYCVDAWRKWYSGCLGDDHSGAVEQVATELVAVLEELQPEQQPGGAT